MRILHVLSQRPEATGSGIYLQAALRETEKRGHVSRLIAGIPSGPPPELEGVRPDNTDWVRFDGEELPFAVVGMSDAMPYPSTCFRDLDPDDINLYESVFGERVRESVDRFRPDLIHTHHLWLLTSVVRRSIPHVPVVTTCHGSDLRQFQHCPHMRDQVVEGCLGLDAVLALSQAQKQEIESLYGIEGNRIHVVGAGYNDELFHPGEERGTDTIDILYAGRLSRAKGLPWLLAALERIPDLPWRLHLVGGGGGPGRADIETQASLLGDRARFHGSMDQAELAGWMRRSHLFVLPSLFEGLPLVLIEAFACNCRLVATALPGVAELFADHDTGAISIVDLPRLQDVDIPHVDDEAAFEERLAAALAEQIEATIAGQPTDRSVIEELISHHTWSKVFDRIDFVYQQIEGVTASR
jgi:glycosyltransferase involved in cell wall biosynthesis